MAQAPHGDDGTRSGAAVDPPVPPGVDPSAPAPAGHYDYYLGGSNNFEARRMAAGRLRQGLPELSGAAWANRGFSFTGQWGAADPIAADSDASRVLYCEVAEVARCP